MDKAAIHPKTRLQLTTFVDNPSHALCLIGPPGAGKSYLAQLVADQLLGKHTDDAIYKVGQDQTSISIEEIRALQKFLKLKKPGAQAVKRIIILENAHNMGDEAQNALLKTLEEPPADTVFILTTNGSASLKSTIYSRVQSVQVLPLVESDAAEYFKGNDFSKAFHLSGGYAGLLYALLNDQDHQLVAAVEQAKQLIQSSAFERLIQVDALAKQKEQLPTLFYALQRVIGALVAKTTDKTRLKRLTASLRAIYSAEVDFQASANPKLLLSDLFLQL